MLGEFANIETDETYTEGADFIKKGKNETDFEGEYFSTWQEGGKMCSATLKIKKRTNTIYKFEWLKGNNCIFKGEGFVVDDILIGQYQAL